MIFRSAYDKFSLVIIFRGSMNANQKKNIW